LHVVFSLLTVKINKVALFHGSAGVECVAAARAIGIIGNVGMKKVR
jgi:hypothetical protein